MKHAGAPLPPQDSGGSERRYFWLAIAGAVVVLLALLGRLLTPLLGEKAGPLP